MSKGWPGRIGVAIRVHKIVEWNEAVGWGVGECGWAGSARPAREKNPQPLCRACYPPRVRSEEMMKPV